MRTLAFLLCVSCGAAPSQVVIPVSPARGALSLTDAKSYELWVLSQIGRDGSPITCDGLLDRSLAPGGSEAVRLVAPIDRNFDSQPVHIGGIAPGVQNRVFYVDLYSAANQGGDIIGSGCAPSVTINAGSDAHVQLLVSPPPAP